MNITVTPAAETFMRRMVRFGNRGADAGFRLTVTAGGCSGLSTAFDIVRAPGPNERTLDVNGLKIFLSPESGGLLQGATIDFRDSGTALGLTVISPNPGNCACGSAAGTGHATVDISALRRKH